MDLVKKITICEVGPRDGIQNEKNILTCEQKVELINSLTDAGFKVIEVGSFMHPKAVPQLADTDEVFKRINKKEGVEYRALIANVKGVQRAINCGCKKVKLNVSASRAHNLSNLNSTPEETIAGFKDCVDVALENGIDVSGSISMPFGSPWEHKIPVEDIKSITEAYVKAGVNEISLSDTSGMGVPNQVYNICNEMKQAFPHVKWILHFHNTRGTGIANIIAGMAAGFTWFDTSFAGAGGCPFVPGAAGNVSTEDLVHMCDEMGIKTGIDIDKVIDIGKKVTKLIGHDGDSYVLRAGKSTDLLSNKPTGQEK
jgi:hydroxymethylglutaryl-CoA lyase